MVFGSTIVVDSFLVLAGKLSTTLRRCKLLCLLQSVVILERHVVPIGLEVISRSSLANKLEWVATVIRDKAALSPVIW